MMTLDQRSASIYGKNILDRPIVGRYSDLWNLETHFVKRLSTSETVKIATNTWSNFAGQMALSVRAAIRPRHLSGKARVWKCYGKHDSPKFSLKTGTIFEDSPLGLDKWLPASG